MNKLDVLHKLIDVAAGRANLPSHEADELHDAVTPGYNETPPTAEEIAAAQAVLAAAAPPPAPEPVAEPEPEPGPEPELPPVAPVVVDNEF